MLKTQQTLAGFSISKVELSNLWIIHQDSPGRCQRLVTDKECAKIDEKQLVIFNYGGSSFQSTRGPMQNAD